MEITPQGSEADAGQAQERLDQRLAPVLVLTFIFFLHFTGRQLTGPLLPAMETDLGIGHAVGGLFILSMGMGFFLSQLAASFFNAKFGYKTCVLLSLWGTAASMAVVALMESAWALLLAFFGLGVTGGLYVPSGIALISVMVRPQDWGKAMGIHELAPNLALIMAPFFATAAVTAVSWRSGYLVLSGLLALMGGIYARWGVDAPDRASFPGVHQILKIARMPAFWALGLLLSLAVGVETGVYAVLSLFLVHERGFDLTTANQLLGISRIPGLAMVLVSGWITDRLSPYLTLRLALFTTGGCVILLGIGPGSAVVPAIFLQAAAAACLFPPILSAASGISTTENRSLTICLSLAVAPILGGGLMPAGIALAGELGSFGLGLAGTGVLVVMGVVLVRVLRLKG